VIGTAELDTPQGVAHAALAQTLAYGQAVAAAQTLGRRFALTQFWSSESGDFADIAASLWEGGRLALEDMTGRELGVNNIVVLEGVASVDGAGAIRVVADFRSDMARVAARLGTNGLGGGNRTRPAA
jgi:hypothetical protein